MSHKLYPMFFVVWKIMSYDQIMSFYIIYVGEHIMSFKKFCPLTSHFS